MLGIYARSFMTATRTEQIDLRETPRTSKRPRRWLPKGHWWLQSAREDDPTRS